MWSGMSISGKSTPSSGKRGSVSAMSQRYSRTVIRLVLHGELRQFSPGARKVMEVEGTRRRADEVLRALGSPLGDTAAFIVNGEQREADTLVGDGDTLEVLPAISRGADGPRGALDGIRVV